MSRLQKILSDGGCTRIYSGLSSSGITYEVWAQDGLAFIIDNNRADGEMDTLYGLYEEDLALHKARRLAER